MNLKDTYNKIAELWHKDHSGDSWWVEGTEKLASMLPIGATILDVGCGAGTKAKYLTNKGFKVTGIDFAEKQIAIAKREVPTADFKVMDMRDIASLGVAFDCVFAQAAILHIPKNEVDDVLKIFKSVLRPGGLLYIAVKEQRQGQGEEEVKKESDYGFEYERFFSYFTLDELKERFAKLDLLVRYSTVNPTGKTNWIQIIGERV